MNLNLELEKQKEDMKNSKLTFENEINTLESEKNTLKGKNSQLLLDNKKLVKISKDLQKKQDEQKELLNQMAFQNNQKNYIPNNNNSLNENIENNDSILRSNKLNPNKRLLSNSNIYKNNNNYNNEPIINEGYIQEPKFIKSNGNNENNINNSNIPYNNYNEPIYDYEYPKNNQNEMYNYERNRTFREPKLSTSKDSYSLNSSNLYLPNSMRINSYSPNQNLRNISTSYSPNHFINDKPIYSQSTKNIFSSKTLNDSTYNSTLMRSYNNQGSLSDKKYNYDNNTFNLSNSSSMRNLSPINGGYSTINDNRFNPCNCKCHCCDVLCYDENDKIYIQKLIDSKDYLLEENKKLKNHILILTDQNRCLICELDNIVSSSKCGNVDINVNWINQVICKNRFMLEKSLDEIENIINQRKFELK